MTNPAMQNLPLVFFAPANGFPAASYTCLFTELTPHYQIKHIAQHGHDPRFPVTDNWEQLVDELLLHLQALNAPVWGIGHSFGAFIHYHAALRHPEHYLGLILLDAPILNPLERFALGWIKRLGLIEQLSPAGRTSSRCSTFQNIDQARTYFSKKYLFRKVAPASLEAYLTHGLVHRDGALHLRFDPEIEAQIYRTIPHRLPCDSRPLELPVALLYGQQSRIVLARHLRQLARFKNSESHALPGTHLFPLEDPSATAAMIHNVLERWQTAAKE